MMIKQKSLIKSYFFWFIWVFGIFSCLTAMILIQRALENQDGYYSCHPTFLPTCLETLFNNMKIPLGILTATVTIAGFWTLLFRSEQTAKQIEVTIENNIYKNYIDHKKDFFLLLKTIEDELGGKFIDSTAFYYRLFPTNSRLSFSPIGDERFISIIVSSHMSSISHLKECIIKNATLNSNEYITYFNDDKMQIEKKEPLIILETLSTEIYNFINLTQEAFKNMHYIKNYPIGIEKSDLSMFYGTQRIGKEKETNLLNKSIHERYFIIQKLLLFSEFPTETVIDSIKPWNEIVHGSLLIHIQKTLVKHLT